MATPDAITRRLLEQVGCLELLDRFDSLSASDANSLLMVLFNRLAGRLTPRDLLKNYAHNRYAAPSAGDPARYHKTALELLDLAKANGFAPITLSPAALQGSCSVLASVSQNKIISASRGTELLADPTNMLAVHIADGIKNGSLSHGDGGIHLCAAQRVTRVQAMFPKGFYPHFGLFCLVSAGRDSGSYAFEKQALVKHLALYESFFRKRGDEGMSLTFRARGGYADSAGFFAAMRQASTEAFPHIESRAAESDFDNPYYLGVNVKFYLPGDGRPVELGDMGFVDWTQKLLGRRKERMFISAMGLERLRS